MPEKPFDVVVVDGKSTLWVDSERIQESVAYYQDNKIDFLGVNPQRGYFLKDIEFLRHYPEVSALVLVGPAIPFELTPLEALYRLRSLIVSFLSKSLRLDWFPELEEFRGYWHSGLQLAERKSLRILDLTGYNPKSKNLTDFPRPPSLRELTLVQSTLTVLLGVSRIQGLSRLELAHLSKLESLHDVEQLRSLEILVCQKCRKLRDHDVVKALPKLRVLRFNDCGEIPNLKFLEDMGELEEFRFVNTNIADGDLSPLLRLKRVGFLGKRHYSHTPEQLDAILRLKGGSAIARIE